MIAQNLASAKLLQDMVWSWLRKDTSWNPKIYKAECRHTWVEKWVTQIAQSLHRDCPASGTFLLSIEV